MSASWTNHVLNGFGQAASRYESLAVLQRAVAQRLAGLCSRSPIPRGLWVDLGSGTGLLADALEASHPGQSVLRIDGSAAMLDLHPTRAQTARLDLNNDLPQWSQDPMLLASSFSLHWLPAPHRVLRHWFERLGPGGWLAVTVPVAGSFPQWQRAAETARVPCTALPLPETESLLQELPVSAVQRCLILKLSQNADHPIRLLKPMSAIGAGSTPAPSLSPAAWRRLCRAWPRPSDKQTVTLTWHVLLLLVKR